MFSKQKYILLSTHTIASYLFLVLIVWLCLFVLFWQYSKHETIYALSAPKTFRKQDDANCRFQSSDNARQIVFFVRKTINEKKQQQNASICQPVHRFFANTHSNAIHCTNNRVSRNQLKNTCTCLCSAAHSWIHFIIIRRQIEKTFEKKLYTESTKE